MSTSGETTTLKKIRQGWWSRSRAPSTLQHSSEPQLSWPRDPLPVTGRSKGGPKKVLICVTNSFALSQSSHITKKIGAQEEKRSFWAVREQIKGKSPRTGIASGHSVLLHTKHLTPMFGLNLQDRENFKIEYWHTQTLTQSQPSHNLRPTLAQSPSQPQPNSHPSSHRHSCG